MSGGWEPDWVVAPGDTLAEWFEEMGVPHAVARRYGISVRTLDRLFAGDQRITPSLAQQLSAMTLVSARFWLALERNYRAGLAAGKRVL